MSTHLTVRFGEHGEEYPVRINYHMGYDAPIYKLTEQYTQVGPDQEAWEVYDSETDKEVELWNKEIALNLAEGYITISDDFKAGGYEKLIF